MRESIQENLYPDVSQELVASIFMVDMLRVGRTVNVCTDGARGGSCSIQENQENLWT
jgi:hypothetical protein